MAGQGEQAEPALVAVSTWPATRLGYRLAGTAAEPELSITVSAGAPGPDDCCEAIARSGAEQAGRYQQIGAQLDEPGLTVSLLTSLNAGLLLPVPEGVATLRCFARSAELFAQATATAAGPELTGLATLDELLDRYGLTADRLAAAHADRPLNRLLEAGQPLAMRTGQLEPDTVPAGLDTLAQVAAGLHLAPGQLLTDNRGLRLAVEPAVMLPGVMSLPLEARIPYRVQPGDTLADLARRFGSSPREVVAGNAEVAGTLRPGTRVEVAVPVDGESVLASTDTVAGDSISAVVARLAGQHAGVGLDAVADALDQLGPVLEAGPVLSCPLAVLGSGRSDGVPLTAAEAAADFGCPPAAFAAANAALVGVLQPGVRLSHGDRTTTTAVQDTLHSVLDRLGPDTGLPWPERLGQLLAAHATVPMFRDGARALLPALAVTVSASPAHAVEPDGSAVPLTVTLRLARGEERADTSVPPADGWDDLVEACLATLPAVRLATDPQGTVWAVPFGGTGISTVRIDPAADPAVFGLPAAYPTLLDFTALVSPATEQGELGAPVTQQFSGADTELWGRLLLTDLDRCLTEPLRSRLPDAAQAELAEIRRQLATTLAGNLAPVLHGGHAGPALATARTAFASLAHTGLASTYAAAVLVHYPATVAAPYGGEGQPAARLAGNLQTSAQPELHLSGSRIELAPSAAGCTFALGTADPSRAMGVPLAPHQTLEGVELDGPEGPVLLQFAHPLAGNYLPEGAELAVADLPPVEVPVPLRDHPHPAVAVPMTATASFTGPGQPSLAAALRWTAGLSYTHQHAAQDIVRLTLGRPVAASAPVATPGNLALAEALARYATAAPTLMGLLDADGLPSEDARPGRAAATALVELATAVATAWRDHRIERTPAGTAEPVFTGNPDATWLTGDYRLRAVYAGGPDDERLLDRLVVSRADATGGWPEIAVDLGDRQVVLTPGPVAEGSCEYTVDEQLTVGGPLTVRVAWPGLLGTPTAGAAVTLSVRRNPALPGVSPDFVLGAEPVRVEIASPSLRWVEPLTLPGDDLAQALQQTFEVLADKHPERRATIEVRYAEPLGEVQFVLPALLAEAVLNAESAISLAAAMRDWQLKALTTVADEAVWQLCVRVDSPRGGEPPLVTFEQLVYPASPGGEPALVPVGV